MSKRWGARWAISDLTDKRLGAAGTANAQDVSRKLNPKSVPELLEITRELLAKSPTEGPGSKPDRPTARAIVAALPPPIPILTNAVAGPGKPAKYRNERSGRYASKREAKRAGELAVLARAGLITELREQVPFLLIPKQKGERACHYLADFCYRDATGRLHVEDVKAEITKTPVFRIKKKLMLLVHRVRIEMV